MQATLTHNWKNRIRNVELPVTIETKADNAHHKK